MLNSKITSLTNFCDYNLDVIIAMHPFFLPDCHLTTKYINDWDNLIKNYPGVMIIFEEKDKKRKLVNQLNSLNIEHDRLIIETVKMGPDPLKMSYNDFFKFLDNFNKRPFMLMGGYLNNNYEPLERGCLGHLAHLLDQHYLGENSYDIIPGLTF
jgi:hypothetical protein